MKNQYNIGALAGIALILSGSSAMAQFNLGFAPEYYYWQESANGITIHESGPRYGAELSYKQPQDEGWLWAARVKFYYGSVHYDGQTFAGTPVSTTTDYYGGFGELRYGYRWSWTEDQYVDLMGGAGVEDWERSLNGPGGSDENWLPIYFKAGLELCPVEKGWIGTLGVKVPVYTVETVDASNVGGGTVTLHPGVEPSLYVEAGYQFTRRLSAVAFFDSYWFAKSPTEPAGSVLIYQPESKSYRVGVKFGWSF
ncbi:MAG TPA: hypothetical protein VGY56_21755 [Verrucomicrobiae bacterium]|nr:hypothetical protein [Verrucomicrobiae bacterium]